MSRCDRRIDAGCRRIWGAGIYLDAETAGVTVENNLVYRVSSQTMNMSNGPAQAGAPNIIQNNIFAYDGWVSLD